MIAGRSGAACNKKNPPTIGVGLMRKVGKQTFRSVSHPRSLHQQNMLPLPRSAAYAVATDCNHVLRSYDACVLSYSTGNSVSGIIEFFEVIVVINISKKLINYELIINSCTRFMVYFFVHNLIEHF